MVAIAIKPPKVAAKPKVPDFLVKEEIDRVRFYYRNYKDFRNYLALLFFGVTLEPSSSLA